MQLSQRRWSISGMFSTSQTEGAEIIKCGEDAIVLFRRTWASSQVLTLVFRMTGRRTSDGEAGGNRSKTTPAFLLFTVSSHLAYMARRRAQAGSAIHDDTIYNSLNKLCKNKKERILQLSIAVATAVTSFFPFALSMIAWSVSTYRRALLDAFKPDRMASGTPMPST